MLYSTNQDGDTVRLYEMYDGADKGIGDGIQTERYDAVDPETGSVSPALRLTSNGSFNVNIRSVGIPGSLMQYVVEPMPEFCKHMFAGE